MVERTLTLHDYKIENVPINYGLGKEELVLEIYYEYKGINYLTKVDLDIANIVEVAIYDADGLLISCTDTGENVYYVFKSLVVPISDFEKYVRDWMTKNESIIF